MFKRTKASAILSTYETAPDVGVGSLLTIQFSNGVYEVREATHQNRAHLVVPVIMMVEGVHHGSHGPLLHLEAELAHCLPSWNGIPISVLHPEIEGTPVSANAPDVIDQQSVGRVYNAAFVNGQLRAEAWLDVSRLGEVSPQAMAYIRQGRPLEVSVGVFTDDELTPGDWQGEAYQGIAHNHRPDHLALLPGGVGACSWADGCGIRANEGGDSNLDVVLTTKALAGKGLSVVAMNMLNNEQSYGEVIRQIQTKLDQMDNDVRVHYLAEVYEDYFVYRVVSREGGSASGNRLYSRSYTVNAEGAMAFSEEPIPVVRKVEYVAIPQSNSTFTRTIPPNNNKGGTTMENTKCCPEKVELLVQSDSFTEADRAAIELLPETVVDKLIVMSKAAPVATEKTVVTEPAPTADITEQQAVAVLSAHLSDPDKFLKLLPTEMQDQMQHGLALHGQARVQMVKGILANSQVYTEDELKAFPTAQLEKLARAIAPSVDYTGYGAGAPVALTTQTVSEEPLLPPGVVAKEEATT